MSSFLDTTPCTGKIAHTHLLKFFDLSTTITWWGNFLYEHNIFSSYDGMLMLWCLSPCVMVVSLLLLLELKARAAFYFFMSQCLSSSLAHSLKYSFSKWMKYLNYLSTIKLTGEGWVSFSVPLTLGSAYCVPANRDE